MPSHRTEKIADLDLSNIGVIIPTWKAEPHWEELSESLASQGVPPEKVLIVDSSSPDNTCLLARQSGYNVVIPQKDFGHGKTRQAASTYFRQADFLIYLTQDVVFDSPTSICRLHSVMEDPLIGAAYGRQVARRAADAIERHARLYNYPKKSEQRVFKDRAVLGIKSAFLSNSFAIYRRSALYAVGGFPEDVIFGEDSFVAGRLLIAGWKVAYEAGATVVHSHPFTLAQEFRRYFDIGVHHELEAWLLQTFGTASGEGARFVKSELSYLWKHHAALIPLAVLRSGLKLMAYRMGRFWRRLPAWLTRRLSSNPAFWSVRR
jgi:rhamnosyltransferase